MKWKSGFKPLLLSNAPSLYRYSTALENTKVYQHYRRHTTVRRTAAGVGGGSGLWEPGEAGEEEGEGESESEFSYIGGGGGDKGDVELSDGGALKSAAGGFGGSGGVSGGGGGGGGGGGSWGGGSKRDASTSAAGVRSILRKTWPHAYSVAVIYAVTLSIFPGFLAEDVSSAALGDWYPVVLISAFDLADVVGKMAPRWFPGVTARLTPMLLVGLSTARVLFVPAFLMTTR
jgi:hypothetical protein